MGAAATMFYLMLVFAPRELADPGAPRLAWIIRYALFLVTLGVALLIGGFPAVLI